MIDRLIRGALAPIRRELTSISAEIHKTWITEQDGTRRGVVAIEVTQKLVDACKQNWSQPVQMRFAQDGRGQWAMVLRPVTAPVQEAYEQSVAQRAARQ